MTESEIKIKIHQYTDLWHYDWLLEETGLVMNLISFVLIFINIKAPAMHYKKLFHKH